MIAAVADLVAARLRDEHVIPAVLPAYIGQAIAEAAGHSQFQWVHAVPLQGSRSIATRWVLSGDGSAHLELSDWQGQVFWRGTFRAAPAPAAGDGRG